MSNNQDGSSSQKNQVKKEFWSLNEKSWHFSRNRLKFVLTSFVILILLGANVCFTSDKFIEAPDLTSLISTPAKANPIPTSLNYSNLDISSSTRISKLDYRELSINYDNNTPVWISLSPNAYAYHKTYSCAANRTKYEVIKVTTTEAREKYHRSPCKICQPK